jgi:hypothetical protein
LHLYITLTVLIRLIYEGVSKSFRTGRLEQELQMVQFSATRCSCIAILWVSLVNFASITLCVASQWVFIVVSVYFVMDSVRKLLDTSSYVLACDRVEMQTSEHRQSILVYTTKAACLGVASRRFDCDICAFSEWWKAAKPWGFPAPWRKGFCRTRYLSLFWIRSFFWDSRTQKLRSKIREIVKSLCVAACRGFDMRTPESFGQLWGPGKQQVDHRCLQFSSRLRGYIQKFPDWVEKEINSNNNTLEKQDGLWRQNALHWLTK